MRIFQTFCHINEYEDRGFANLHRMIASSEPLVLWAPSSQLLSVPQCRVSRDEFVEYVEQGRVRIAGRTNWLLDKDARNDPVRMPWPGARWDDLVDGAILAIAREDRDLPDDDKRVLVAPDERGDEYATRYLEEHPDEVENLNTLLLTAEERNELPLGLLGSLQRQAPEPHALARLMLRHVFNHGEAIHLAGAKAPFFLAPRESTFLKLLDESLRTGVSLPANASDAAEPEPAPLSPEEYARLTEEVFGVLSALDRGRAISLKAFLASAGHQALSTWFSQVCDQLEELSPERRAGRAVGDLQKRYESGALDVSPKQFLASLGGFSGIAGNGLAAADWIAAGTISGFGLAGLAVGLVGPGQGALRALGYTRAGPREWPFLYSFGHRPTRNQYERVVNALDHLTPSA